MNADDAWDSQVVALTVDEILLRISQDEEEGSYLLLDLLDDLTSMIRSGSDLTREQRIALHSHAKKHEMIARIIATSKIPRETRVAEHEAALERERRLERLEREHEARRESDLLADMRADAEETRIRAPRYEKSLKRAKVRARRDRGRSAERAFVHSQRD